MGFGLIPLNNELQQDDRTVCCGHTIVTFIPNIIPRDGGRGVWEGLGMEKNMAFVLFVAASKYRNAKLSFSKEYGFSNHLTPKIL